tara:strand:+ start:7849 stop:9216 length:1368 start_codon:yes stop_codon:yes gene_type:complete
MQMIQKFDIIIIGSGGGSKITRPAANLGLNVAVIDHGALGGTCLNRGCIPSKMLIHPADVLSEIRSAHNFHIHLDGPITVDTRSLVDYVSTVVAEESNSIKPLYEAHENITYFSETAQFKSNKEIQVGDQVITADTIFIAVGGRPFIPPIKGLLDTPFWTSTEVLRATKLPKKCVVIGGGYIAVELGYYLQSMGVEVVFLVRNRMIKHEDDTIISLFEDYFSKQYQVVFGANPTKITHQKNEFSIYLDDDNPIVADALLVATGIQPNSDVLGTDNTDIQCDEQGFIQVDDYLQTAVEGVYAFGDCVGRYQFRHSANFEGQYLFDHVVKDGIKKPIDYPPVPHAIFTNPQVAGVGLTERECQDQKRNYYCGINWYKDSAMGMALKSDKDFVKLLFDAESHCLIGAHIIGKEAATMIHMCILAMNLNATHADLNRMIYIHPALPEVIRNAVRNAISN